MNTMMDSKDSNRLYFSSEISVKETDEGEVYSEGLIATTHPDRASDEGLGVDGDILSKEVIHQICDFINGTVASIKSIGSTRAVSVMHDWIKEGDPNKEPAGMAMPPAEVLELDGGHYGVHVKTHHNKRHPEFSDIVYKVKHGYYPGYSIEYKPGDYSLVNFEGKTYRFLKSIETFVGYAFASARKIANPAALITHVSYKEISENIKEEKNMSENLDLDALKAKRDAGEELSEEEKAALAKAEAEEAKPADEDKPKKEEPEPADKPEAKEVKGDKKISMKEIGELIRETPEYKEILNSAKVASKVIKQGEQKMDVSIKEMREAISKGDNFSFKEIVDKVVFERKDSDSGMTLFEQKMAEVKKQGYADLPTSFNVKVTQRGLKLSGFQVKGTLGTGDNTSSYTQADVEFADAFVPGILDTFNNRTDLFGFLNKEQHVGGEHYQWRMITNRDPESNSTFVGHNDVSVAKNYSSKAKYQTPLKIARRGVSVTDFVDRYSAASLGDLFRLEVEAQMNEMMNDVNAALFAEVADGAGNAPLGLEAVADSAGNTTLYGLTRSTANRLAPDSAGDTYTAVGGNLTDGALRTKITHLETEGSRKADVAIVCSPAVRDYLFNLMDGQQRFNTTEAMFGFNRMQVPVYDGVPIIVDSDCNADALYVIDKASDVIVIGMAPQLTNLAKVGAATEAYLQMDFAHVYKQPRRIGMLDTLSGPSS